MAAKKKNGLIQELGPNGEVLKSTEYVDGKKHGIQTCYGPDGSPNKITTYENNARVYEETYYKGKIVSKTSYYNGKKEGKCELFENGIKVSEANYANGKKDGIALSYHPNGQIASKYQYHNGKRDWKETEEYHQNGQPSKIVMRGEDGNITDTMYKLDNGIPTVQYVYHDDMMIKTIGYYLNGVIGSIERGDRCDNAIYFDPNGNQISHEEYYATGLCKHVGWGNWNYPLITEREYIAKRDEIAADRLSKRNSELREFGTAWTELLKITPVQTIDPKEDKSTIDETQIEVEEPIVRESASVYNSAPIVQYRPAPVKLGFWGKVAALLTKPI